MRTKLVALAIPLLVLLGVVTAIAGFESHRQPDWKAALNQYLASRSVVAEHFSVQRVASAQHPMQFRAEMGSAVLSLQNSLWQIDSLPYPPDAVYCVLLGRNTRPSIAPAQRPAGQVIYVAHLSDRLWRVGWIVHEGPEAPFPSSLAADLSMLGCDLSLDS